MQISSPALQKIINLYREGLTGFSHVVSIDNLNSTFLFQGYIVGAASERREGNLNAYFKDRIRSGNLQLPGSSMMSTGFHGFLMTSTNRRNV